MSRPGEFELIAAIKERVKTGTGLVRGIGDDCAVARLAAGEVLLTTTDLLAENIHFRRDWTDFESLGRKTVSVNVSDLAAMGAIPRFLYMSLALPDDLGSADINAFITGFLDACDAYGAVLAGGDTCRSAAGLTVSVSAQGVAPEDGWVGRNGAMAGDEIYLTGTVGDSALALKQLLAGKDPVESLLRRHIDPIARVDVGRRLADLRVARSMIDISDGLLADLEHILRESGVGAELELGRIPLSPEFRAGLAGCPEQIELALAGGEDYELLFTAPPGSTGLVEEVAAETGVAITRIGRLVASPERLRLFGRDGEVALPAARGFRHFSANGN